jgi:hypothetical protein
MSPATPINKSGPGDGTIDEVNVAPTMSLWSIPSEIPLKFTR